MLTRPYIYYDMEYYILSAFRLLSLSTKLDSISNKTEKYEPPVTAGVAR